MVRSVKWILEEAVLFSILDLNYLLSAIVISILDEWRDQAVQVIMRLSYILDFWEIKHRLSCNKKIKIALQPHELPAVFWSVVFHAPFPMPLISLLAVHRWNTVSVNTTPCVSILNSRIDRCPGAWLIEGHLKNGSICKRQWVVRPHDPVPVVHCPQCVMCIKSYVKGWFI